MNRARDRLVPLDWRRPRKWTSAESHTEETAQPDEFSVGVVLWSGLLGGAETWSLALAQTLMRHGIKTSLILIGEPGPIFSAAIRSGIPTEGLGLRRGSDVLRRPSALATAVERHHVTAAVVPSSGYLSAVLRLGGYDGVILAVEHGCLLQLGSLSWPNARGVGPIG